MSTAKKPAKKPASKTSAEKVYRSIGEIRRAFYPKADGSGKRSSRVFPPSHDLGRATPRPGGALQDSTE